MSSYVVPPVYAAFVWWFSTGAVLLLVGLSARFDALRLLAAGALTAAALYGLATSANELSVVSAYTAFTATILLWGAQEIAFLAGWLTGPRAEPCPPDARGLRRLGLALAAILYHELSLLVCGVAVLIATSGGVNPVGLWTFMALWVLRQSSKINLFLGVPVTNDELMPPQVAFLKTYFARQPVGAFFTLSVTLAIAMLAIMIQRMVEVAVTPFEIASLGLVSALFALGIVEHWFMLLPLPALTLWGWGVRSQPRGIDMQESQMGPDRLVLDQAQAQVQIQVKVEAIAEPRAATPPQLTVVAGSKRDARQRLEDQFRQRFLEQHAHPEMKTADLSVESAALGNGRTS